GHSLVVRTGEQSLPARAKSIGKLAERFGGTLMQLGETSDGGLPLSVEGIASGSDGLLRAIQALLGLAQLACGAVLVMLDGGQRLVGASDGLDHLALVKLLERL